MVTTQVDAITDEYPSATVTIEEAFFDTTVVGDSLLVSVIRYLLENAIKHNDKDIPRVTVATEEHDDRVTVRVCVNGAGIPDERKAAIFEKGEKGLASSGLGIGLYLVETVVDIYGGDVWVEDNDPEGAVFVVELRKTE